MKCKSGGIISIDEGKMYWVCLLWCTHGLQTCTGMLLCCRRGPGSKFVPPVVGREETGDRWVSLTKTDSSRIMVASSVAVWGNVCHLHCGRIVGFLQPLHILAAVVSVKYSRVFSENTNKINTCICKYVKGKNCCQYLNEIWPGGLRGKLLTQTSWLYP